MPAFLLEQAGRADYARTHHTELDTYDAVIPEYLRHNAVALAIAALALADLERMLPREGLAAPASGACAQPTGSACRSICTGN